MHVKKSLSCVLLLLSLHSYFSTLHGEISANDDSTNTQVLREDRCNFDEVYQTRGIRPETLSYGTSVYMQCAPAQICGKYRFCKYAIKKSCSAPFEYLANLIRTRDNTANNQLCCQYGGSDLQSAIEICENLKIQDKYFYPNGSATTAAGFGQRSKRSDTVLVRKVPVEFYFSPVGHTQNYTNRSQKFVKTIKKQSYGYDIVLCSTMSCKTTASGSEGVAAGAAGTAGAAVNERNRASVVDRAPIEQTEHGPDQREDGPSATLFIPSKPMCFPGDSFVITLAGPKFMQHLTLDDRVLVAQFSQDSHAVTLAYETIELFLHYDPTEITDYLTIITLSGNQMSLTRHHMLALSNCQLARRINITSRHMQFAYRAQPGMCTLTIDQKTASIQWDRIVTIKREYKSGLYAPVTRSGSIIVNNAVASCFGHLENHEFQRNIFQKFFLYRDWWRKMVTTRKSLVTNFLGINWHLGWIIKIAGLMFN